MGASPASREEVPAAALVEREAGTRSRAVEWRHPWWAQEVIMGPGKRGSYRGPNTISPTVFS
jgi:hypothetical protein